VCASRVDLFVCSLPLHRHSYIGFILAFASSFHNKQRDFSPLTNPAETNKRFKQQEIVRWDNGRSRYCNWWGTAHSGLFHFRRAASSPQLQTKVGNTLPKGVALRINLNFDGTPITSRTHTHPSHSQTSRLLTSSLSLRVQVPRGTQCIRVT
jgi:hypothetical protein